MKTTLRLGAIALFAASSLSFPALADDDLIGDITSAVPEAKEDCEALRDSMRDKQDDGVLDPRHMRELRDKGC